MHFHGGVFFFAGFAYPGGMNDLNTPYRELLGFDDAWKVDRVDLDLFGSRVAIARNIVPTRSDVPIAAPSAPPSRHRPGAHLATPGPHAVRH